MQGKLRRFGLETAVTGATMAIAELLSLVKTQEEQGPWSHPVGAKLGRVDQPWEPQYSSGINSFGLVSRFLPLDFTPVSRADSLLHTSYHE